MHPILSYLNSLNFCSIPYPTPIGALTSPAWFPTCNNARWQTSCRVFRLCHICLQVQCCSYVVSSLIVFGACIANNEEHVWPFARLSWYPVLLQVMFVFALSRQVSPTVHKQTTPSVNPARIWTTKLSVVSLVARPARQECTLPRIGTQFSAHNSIHWTCLNHTGMCSI